MDPTKLKIGDYIVFQMGEYWDIGKLIKVKKCSDSKHTIFDIVWLEDIIFFDYPEIVSYRNTLPHFLFWKKCRLATKAEITLYANKKLVDWVCVEA